MIQANFNEMSYDQLTEHANDVIVALRQRAYHEGYTQGKFDASIDSKDANNPFIPKKLTRNEIIEKAEIDVAQIEYEQHENLLRMKYVVNHEKRTVVCLSERYDHGYVDSKGIAKCCPSDSFNVHIGKAIALRRALGIEVPVEYLSAHIPGRGVRKKEAKQ
jgi:hypothetical protein